MPPPAGVLIVALGGEATVKVTVTSPFPLRDALAKLAMMPGAAKLEPPPPPPAEPSSPPLPPP